MSADIKKRIIPHVKQGIMQRPRIDALLLKAAEHPVVTVTAGAGYGKTQAVSMFLNNMNVRAAWLQLSKLDNHEEFFWSNFLHGVSFSDKDTAASLKQLGFPDTLSKFTQFIYLFAKEVYTGNKLAFVFDDFHLISDESVIEFIHNLIGARLENFCIILISRTKTKLSIPGMLTGGLVNQIGMEDLRFTPGETEEYLKSQGRLLPQKDMEKIQTFTEGWPLAIYLVNLSAKKGGTVSDNPIAGAISFIFDMIEREIFSLYTFEIQNLLTKISLLDAFSSGLIKELSGSNFEDFLNVAETNMFIQYDPVSECYNFHHLFLDFLIKKQIYLKEDQISRIYLKAADWCIANDQKIAALNYYKRCGRHDKIWDTVFHLQPARRPKKITDFLISLLDGLPEEYVQKHPMIRVMRASFLLNNLELKTAAEDLFCLIEEMEALPQTQENKAVAGEAYIILTLIYLTLRDFKFIDYIKKADEYLPDGSRFNYSNIRIIDSNYAILPCGWDKEDVDEMLTALFEGVPYISKVMQGLAHGADHLAAAEVAYYSGDFKKAQSNAFRAINKAKQKKQTDIVCSAYYLLMRITFAKGKYEDTVDYMKQLRQYAENSSDEGFISMLDIAEGWFYLKSGMKHNTARWMLDDTLNDSVHSPISVGRDRIARAHYLLEDEKYGEVIAFLESFDELCEKKGLLFGFVLSNVLKTIALYETEEQPQWIAALQYAYDISQKSHCLMQFVELGSHMRKILDHARKLSGHNIPKDWLDGMYAKASTFAKRQAFFKAKYEKDHNNDTDHIGLTKREKEILENLCQGLKREEIAENLYISVSTVRNALNSIYSKLGALNSADAVRIALERQFV